MKTFCLLISKHMMNGWLTILEEKTKQNIASKPATKHGTLKQLVVIGAKLKLLSNYQIEHQNTN